MGDDEMLAFVTDKQSDEKTTIFADTARALREHHGVIGELIAREAMKHN